MSSVGIAQLAHRSNIRHGNSLCIYPHEVSGQGLALNNREVERRRLFDSPARAI